MKLTIKSITQLAVCLALTLAFTAQAEDKKIDLNGSWKSSFTNQQGQARETIFKLKVEDGKLSGAVSGRRKGREGNRDDCAVHRGHDRGAGHDAGAVHVIETRRCLRVGPRRQAGVRDAREGVDVRSECRHGALRPGRRAGVRHADRWLAGKRSTR